MTVAALVPLTKEGQAQVRGAGLETSASLLAVGWRRASEQVVDVPPKLSARARVFATDQGRKTDATDARSIA